ncbi:RHS repeat-associated core domain-containing protein, partial [Cytophagaceae bacterium YF14B1]
KDYYPFGMEMPNRTLDTEKYRYGFNGQESTDEIELGHYTAMFWEYDSKLGRRWNLDPKYFAGESRYATNGNNPIIHVDPQGDFKTRFGAWLYKAAHGGTVGQDARTKEWFVGKQIENANKEDLGITFQRRFDWNGSNNPYEGSGWGHAARSLAASTFGVDGKASNLFDLGWGSVFQNQSAQLTGDLLEKVKVDPAIVRRENALVDMAHQNKKFGKESFTFEYSEGVQFGGSRGSLNPFNISESINTWKVGFSPLTWAVRTATINSQVQVNADGTMHITHSFQDNFDLRPEKGGKIYFGGSGNSPFSSGGGKRPWLYNAACSVLGVPYHDIVGGNDKMKINATWTSDK